MEADAVPESARGKDDVRHHKDGAQQERKLRRRRRHEAAAEEAGEKAEEAEVDIYQLDRALDGPLTSEAAGFLYQSSADRAGAPVAATGVSLHATSTIIMLRSRLAERDATIASLESELKAARAENEQWRRAAEQAGISAPPGHTLKPSALAPAVELMHAKETRLQELLMAARRRETALFVHVAATQQELFVARDQLQQLQSSESLRSQHSQTRRLLLDPAMHAEYSRLKATSEALEKRVRELQDDLAAVQFTPHSRNGKMLMAKCRTLQEENDEIGREAAEGKVHELENKLALQKQLNSELKRGYSELQEYVDDINEEAEKLQETVFKLQRQLQLREQELLELNRFRVATTDSRQPQPQLQQDQQLLQTQPHQHPQSQQVQQQQHHHHHHHHHHQQQQQQQQPPSHVPQHHQAGHQPVTVVGGAVRDTSVEKERESSRSKDGVKYNMLDRARTREEDNDID